LSQCLLPLLLCKLRHLSIPALPILCQPPLLLLLQLPQGLPGILQHSICREGLLLPRCDCYLPLLQLGSHALAGPVCAAHKQGMVAFVYRSAHDETH
jgi:hypothetical protein